MILDVKNVAVLESDLGQLKEWWKWWRFGDVHRFMLPDNIQDSVMIKSENQEICCGFIYRTSASKLFHIEYIVSNPNVKDKDLRNKCIDLLISKLVEKASKMGAVIIYMNLKNHQLINHLKNNGFIVGSGNTQEMVYLNV